MLAGGFDALGVFVASGFEVLRATSREGELRPFMVGRDGMVLGEGAALVARGSNPPEPSHSDRRRPVAR